MSSGSNVDAAALESLLARITDMDTGIFSSNHDLYDEAYVLLGAPKRLADRIEQLEEALSEIADGELLEIVELAINARRIARSK